MTTSTTGISNGDSEQQATLCYLRSIIRSARDARSVDALPKAESAMLLNDVPEYLDKKIGGVRTMTSQHRSANLANQIEQSRSIKRLEAENSNLRSGFATVTGERDGWQGAACIISKLHEEAAARADRMKEALNQLLYCRLPSGLKVFDLLIEAESPDCDRILALAQADLTTDAPQETKT